MLLNINSLEKSFSNIDILKDASFSLNEGERAVLLGANGSGKSTIFRIISGEIEADSGTVFLEKGKSISYLKQFDNADSSISVKDVLKSSYPDPSKLESEMKSLESTLHIVHVQERYNELLTELSNLDRFLNERVLGDKLDEVGLGSEYLEKPVSELSGGQKQKVFLARLTLTTADLMMFDEPTNHLDIGAVEFLENYLKSLKSSYILITHDEQLINSCGVKILYLRDGRIETFNGSYKEYLIDHDLQNKKLIEQKKKLELDKAKATVVVNRFGAGTRSGQARAKKRELAKMEEVELPSYEKEIATINFPLKESLPNDLLSVNGLGFSYGNVDVLKNISFSMYRGERIALLGKNGSGKSTLLKVLSGGLSKINGNYKWGARISVDYFDQEYNLLDKNKNPFDFLSSFFVEAREDFLRTRLGNFLITGDKVFTPIKLLSGGEKARLQLLFLLLKGANFLLLDEPVNNLDISSVSVLKRALLNYKGGLIIVSHDRRLLDELCNRFLIIDEDKLYSYKGSYSENRDKILEHLAVKKVIPMENKKVSSDINRANRTKGPNKYKVKELEDKIFPLEEKKSILDEKVNDPKLAINYVAYQKVVDEREIISKELDELYSLWEELHD